MAVARPGAIKLGGLNRHIALLRTSKVTIWATSKMAPGAGICSEVSGSWGLVGVQIFEVLSAPAHKQLFFVC